VVRDRLHDASGGYAWGEVYQYDLNGRMIAMWRNVRNPQNFGSSWPDVNTVYDDKVDWDIGKVYERESVVTTPKSGTPPITTVSYTSNQGYQYTQIGADQPTWDGNGQMTSDGNDAYQWSARGKMLAFVPASGNTLNYQYDAFGRRVSTTVNGTTTHFLYHGWHMIGAHDGTNWLWQEIPLDSGEQILLHVAKDDADIDGDSNTSEYRTYAVHEDWQDTVWALSDAAGAVKERYVQDDPYGETHTLDANSTDIGLFASDLHHVKRMHGGVTEEASGLYDFRNRWLRPEQGGWLSRDPVFFIDSLNLYQSFRNQPLRQVDYLGECTGAVCGTPGGLGGGHWESDGIPKFAEGGCDCPCQEDFDRLQRLAKGSPPLGHPNPGLWRRVAAVARSLKLDCQPAFAPSACAQIDSETHSVVTIWYNPETCTLIGRCLIGGCKGVLAHEFLHSFCFKMLKSGCSHYGDEEDPYDLFPNRREFTECGKALIGVLSKNPTRAAESEKKAKECREKYM